MSFWLHTQISMKPCHRRDIILKCLKDKQCKQEREKNQKYYHKVMYGEFNLKLIGAVV